MHLRKLERESKNIYLFIKLLNQNPKSQLANRLRFSKSTNKLTPKSSAQGGIGCSSVGNLFLTLILVILAFSNTSFAIIIDDFEVEQVLDSQPEVVTSIALKLPQTSSQRLNALGGTRKLQVEGLEGSKNRKTKLVIEGGTLTHSQDAGSIGISKIIWDGDSKNNEEIVHNLGSYNLTADGSSKILLEILSYDSPTNSEVNFEFKIYNGEKTYITLRRNLSNSIQVSKFLEFAFKDFVAGINSTGVFDLKKVTALELIIHGVDQDIDLQLASVTTDACLFLPNINNLVIDSCGVCNGNNSTCLDCRGVINGNAKKDRCGVCAGDGNSCLDCEVTNQASLLVKLDSGTVNQENLIKQISHKIIKLNKSSELQKLINQKKKQAHELHLQAWAVVWKLPVSTNTCSNQIYCNNESTEPLIQVYQEKTRELKNIMETLILKYKKLANNQDQEYLIFKRKNDLIYSDNLKNLANVPKIQSICSKA